MRNMRMVWVAAGAAGVVVLGGCGGSGTVTADRSLGGTPVGGAVPGGGSTTDRSGSTGGSTTTGGPSASASGSASTAGSTAGSTSAAKPGSGDPCGLVASADVARLAKLPPPASGGAPTTKPSQDNGGNHYCLVDDGEADSAQVGIGAITKDEFDLQKMDPKTQAVDGIGEEALYSPSDGILKVYKGGKQLSVWVIHDGAGFGQTDPDTVAQEKAIASAAVGGM